MSGIARVKLRFSRTCRCWSCAVLLVMVGAVSGVARAAELPNAQVDRAGNDVIAQLDHVQQLLSGRQWEDAAATIGRLIANHADTLVQVPADAAAEPAGFAHFVTVRDYCQMQLGTWRQRAPAALEVYRRDVDALAARLYRQAVATGDEGQLQQVADQFMLSVVGDDALRQLGDRALERADYAAARRDWQRIGPWFRVTPAAARLLKCRVGVAWWHALRGRDIESLWTELDAARDPSATWPANRLIYPDSDIPPAAIWARLVLASILERDGPRAAFELKLLKHWYPEVQGQLAGREGTYVEILTDIWHRSSEWGARPQPPGWSTLGGCAARNRVVPQAIDIALRPIWETRLPRLAAPHDVLSAERARVGESADGLVGYHVATGGGVVFIHQPGMIRALDLNTGQPVWPLPRVGPAGSARSGEIFAWSRAPTHAISTGTPVAGVPRYCVTVDRGRLFARMGQAWTGRRAVATGARSETSFLLGLDTRTQKLLFDRIFPGGEGWQFEAAPIADPGRVYISARRRDPVNSQVCVMCYDISTGREVWQTGVARATSISDTRVEISHSPLTLSGGTLYYNSNMGVIAALRARDGHIDWICRYPRRGLEPGDPDRDDRYVSRDLTPCLAHHDVLLAAPADHDRILALDNATGSVLWRTPDGQAADAIHLMGVGAGNLLAGGDSLYWIGMGHGEIVGRFPASGSPGHEFSRPEPRGRGRGLLAGPYVYWPTENRLYVFDQRLPRLARQPIDLAAIGARGGNLVIDDDVLLIATPDRLFAFNQTGRTPPPGTKRQAE